MIKNNIIKYDIKHIDDFKMDVYEIKENRYINIEKNSILFCMEGNIKINGIKCEEFNSYFVKNKINKAKIELCDGYKYSQLYNGKYLFLGQIFEPLCLVQNNFFVL